MKMIARVVILLVLLTGGTLLLLWHQRQTQLELHRGLRISGTIETTTVEVSFKVAGRLATRLLDEGQVAKAGEPVATLDDEDYRAQVAADQAAVATAQAALAEVSAPSRAEDIAHAKAVVRQAQARLAELKAGARSSELAAAAAAVKAATVDRDHLAVDLKRIAALVAAKIAAPADLDTAQAAYDAAVAHVEQLAANLQLLKDGTRPEQVDQQVAAVAQAQAAVDLLVAGPRAETIASQAARVAQAQAALALSTTRLAYCHVSAPVGGVVVAKHAEPGEYVNPGSPVLTIGDLEHVWLRGYVDETDLTRVKIGQQVVVTCDHANAAANKVYHGTVSFIADQAEFTPKNVQTQKERVKLMYRIKVDIPNPERELKTGMPADATLVLGPDASAPAGAAATGGAAGSAAP